MKIKYGKIISIETIEGLKLKPIANLNEKNGSRLGFSQMVNSLLGYGEKDGFLIKTDKHFWHILIDNAQSCCENWGYISSDDDFTKFIGKEVLNVKLTDKGLNTKMLGDNEYGFDGGGIQFVDFNFTDGSVLQFAVYNAHNGYYGHDIVIARDNKILLKDTL